MKNPVFIRKGQNLGDKKMPWDLRRSLITHLDAILFLRISQERVFQQAQAISLIHQVASDIAMSSGDFETELLPITALATCCLLHKPLALEEKYEE
jgi:hypothetical protein